MVFHASQKSPQQLFPDPTANLAFHSTCVNHGDNRARRSRGAGIPGSFRDDLGITGFMRVFADGRQLYKPSLL